MGRFPAGWGAWRRTTAAPASARKRIHSTNDRIVGILAVSLALLSVLWIRCFWLQVVQAKSLGALARAQYTSIRSLQAQRGAIYDRTGRPLALSVPVPSVFANPRQVSDPAVTAARLAHLVNRNAAAVRQRLEKNKGFVWVARQVDPDLAPQLGAFRGEGIGVIEEPKRFYPHGKLACHLLGFVDIDQQGLEGIEWSLNGALRGQPGWRSTLRDARGHLLVGSWTSEADPINGYDVVLTVDSVVQQAAEEALAWGVDEYHAKGGSIIVMEPHTGAILAMANWPIYDPNEPSNAPAESRRNRAITDIMEPGSVFKTVTASALLEEGLVTPEEQFFCENGKYHTVGRHILDDHTPHGMLSFHDVIAYSSNIGTAKAAQRLKPDVLYRYIRAFGYGQKTGIDMPGEVSGIVAPPAKWSKLSPFIIPIGQEVGVTPLQMAVMMAVIANGGQRVQPYLVERIQTTDGALVRAHASDTPARILRPETAALVQSMLSSVVTSGTGRLANVQGLTVAGKTGTAQKLEPNGRYSHSRFVASFVGFGPVPDSQFVMAVNIDEPRPAYFGGVVAAPIFKRVVEHVASYLNLERTSQPNPAGALL